MQSSSSTITRWLVTFARIAIGDSGAFTALLQASSSRLELPFDQVLQEVLKQWLNRVRTNVPFGYARLTWWFLTLKQYDNLTYSGQRKLVALALTNFVQTTNPNVLGRIDEIITTWLSALGETQESDTGECVSRANSPRTVRLAQPVAFAHTSPAASVSNYSPPAPWQTFPSHGGNRQDSPTVSFSSQGGYSSQQSSEWPSLSQDSCLTGCSTPSYASEEYHTVSMPSSPGMQKQRGFEDLQDVKAESAWTYDEPLLPGWGSANDEAAETCGDDWAGQGDTTLGAISLTRPADGLVLSYSSSSGVAVRNVPIDNGDDDDDDETGAIYYRDATLRQTLHSADTYYNGDEQDDELDLQPGWEGADAGWGGQPQDMTPENARFKAVSASFVISDAIAFTSDL